MGRVTLEIQVVSPRAYLYRVQFAIIEALTTAVDTTLHLGTIIAKKHAPVRKVTVRGGRPHVRDLTDTEIAALPESVRRGISPLDGTFLRTGLRPQTTVRRSGAGFMRPRLRIGGKTHEMPQEEGSLAREVSEDPFTGERFLVNQGRDTHGRANVAALTGAGAHELHGNVRTATAKNPDAVFSRGGQATLGGRLRSEIYATRAKSTGGYIEGELISPTEYAEYVEFPTSRTAAQPYMRPAREEMKPILVREAKRELVRVGGRML